MKGLYSCCCLVRGTPIIDTRHVSFKLGFDALPLRRGVGVCGGRVGRKSKFLDIFTPTPTPYRIQRSDDADPGWEFGAKYGERGRCGGKAPAGSRAELKTFCMCTTWGVCQLVINMFLQNKNIHRKFGAWPFTPWIRMSVFWLVLTWPITVPSLS